MDDFDPKFLARRSDPRTSHAAAQGDRTAIRQKILEAFRQGPGTFEDIAVRTGLKDSQVWKRISELHRAGFIECLIDVEGNEITQTLQSGRQGQVYQKP